MFFHVDTLISRLSMSSSKDSDIFLIKEHNQNMEFDFLKIPTLQFHEQDQEEEEENCICTDVSAEKTDTRPLSLEEPKATKDDDNGGGDYDDDNDGFKTPTSSDHKIPEIKECPPAPRKPKNILSSSSSSTKRKASDQAPIHHVRRSLQMDLCEEVESLFPRQILADFYKKIKKARTGNNGTTSVLQ